MIYGTCVTASKSLIFRALVLQKPLNFQVKFSSKCFPTKIRMESNLNHSIEGNNKASRGALVVLEGLDRSGKSSQCSRLVSFLEGQGISAELWRFPDRTTNVGQMISAYLTNTSQLDDHTIHLLFSANRWEKRKMFTSKEPKGKETAKVVLMPSFWNSVVYTLKVMVPLVKVLRLVDGERKPAMGYIYEAMDKAKETIIKSFNNNESKYKDLHRPLHAAAHFLNSEFFYDNTDLEFDFEVTNGLFECIKKLIPQFDVQQKILTELHLYKIGADHFGSDFAMAQRKTHSPRCERNWSVFEQIHSKKRNRLEHKRLHDLKQRYNAIDEIDPISLNDIDVCNEWLVGEMDRDDDNDAGNDLVFEDDDALNWATVYQASGVGECRMYTRRKKQKTSVAAVQTSKKTGNGCWIFIKEAKSSPRK
ncbi:Thymidylate kinase [Glycine max]|nr:Thymidylate kinase [Glycine max]KAH1218446.1 Thymidylate kinase [Glycine max]